MNRESLLVESLLSFRNFSISYVFYDSGSVLMKKVEKHIRELGDDFLKRGRFIAQNNFIPFGRIDKTDYSPLKEEDLLVCVSAVDLLKNKREVSNFREFYLERIKGRYFPQCRVEDLGFIDSNRVIRTDWNNGSRFDLKLGNLSKSGINQGFDVYSYVFRNKDVISYKRELWEMDKGLIKRR